MCRIMTEKYHSFHAIKKSIDLIDQRISRVDQKTMNSVGIYQTISNNHRKRHRISRVTAVSRLV